MWRSSAGCHLGSSLHPSGAASTQSPFWMVSPWRSCRHLIASQSGGEQGADDESPLASGIPCASSYVWSVLMVTFFIGDFSGDRIARRSLWVRCSTTSQQVPCTQVFPVRDSRCGTRQTIPRSIRPIRKPIYMCCSPEYGDSAEPFRNRKEGANKAKHQTPHL